MIYVDDENIFKQLKEHDIDCRLERQIDRIITGSDIYIAEVPRKGYVVVHYRNGDKNERVFEKYLTFPDVIILLLIFLVE